MVNKADLTKITLKRSFVFLITSCFLFLLDFGPVSKDLFISSGILSAISIASLILLITYRNLWVQLLVAVAFLVLNMVLIHNKIYISPLNSGPGAFLIPSIFAISGFLFGRNIHKIPLKRFENWAIYSMLAVALYPYEIILTESKQYLTGTFNFWHQTSISVFVNIMAILFSFSIFERLSRTRWASNFLINLGKNAYSIYVIHLVIIFGLGFIFKNMASFWTMILFILILLSSHQIAKNKITRLIVKKVLNRN